MANNITFSIGLKTNYDASGVNQLKKELQDIQNLTSVSTGFINKSNVKDLMAMTSAANELERALDAAYDPQLNTVSIDKFNQSLKNSGTNIQKVQQDLSKAGIVGQQAFLKTTGELLQMNATVRNTNSLLDKMATTMANTVRWGLTSALWNNITGSIQTAFYYVKDLDTALNDIRIVTGKSAEDMANFAVEANNAAKALAVTTEDYTRGALIYYQQGLDDETVRTLTDITSMTANVTGQGIDTVSEQLTAVWNGYQVANQAAEEGIGVYEEYVDKMAAVGAATASDLEELSTAMSKVASAAASMGVGFDSLNAQIATIVSVTRQAPESVGTALKTIYARMGDLQLGKSDEDGVGLGQVSGELDKLGIAVLDANGNMRDMEEVITEVGEAWDTWTEAERQAIAVALAGKRQYNNLIALFDNWTMYTDTLNVSLESAGTLQEQQAIATESLANKMDVLRATAEDLYDNLFNEEVIGKSVDVFTDFVQILADVTEALGGLENILPALSGVMMTMFSNQIGKNVGDLVIGFQNLTSTSQNSLQNLQAIKDMFQGGLVNADLNTLGISQDSASMETLKASLADIVNYYEDMASKRSLMNEKEYEAYNAILKQKVAVGDLQLEYVKLSQSLLDDKHAQFLLGSGGISFNSNEDIARLKQDTVALQNYYDLLDTRSVKSAKTVGELRDALENLNNQSSSINHLDFSNIKGSLEEFFGEFKYSNNVEIASQDLQQYRQRILQTIQTTQNLTRTNDKLASSFGNTTDSVNRLNKQLELKAAINSISRLAGSVTQLTSALNIFKNIGNIWSNENLTGGEKLLQTVMNLGSAIGLLISGITGLTTALSKENREKMINLATTLLQSSAERKLNAQKQINLATSILARKNLKAETRAKWETILANNMLIKQNGLLGEWMVKLKGLFKGGAAGATTLAEANAAVGASGGTAAAGLGAMAAPIAIIVALLAALVIGISAVNAVQENKLKAAKEDLEATKAQVAATKEQIEANEQLVSSYDDLINKFDEGTISEEEFRKGAVDICDQMDLQSEKIKVLCGDYETLEQSIRKANIAQKEALLTDLEQQKKDAEAVMGAGFAKGTGTGDDLLDLLFMTNPYTIAGNTINGNTMANSEFVHGGLNTFASADITTSAEAALGNYFTGDGVIGQAGGFTIGGVETAEDQYKVYTAIQEVLKENAKWANTTEYKQLQEIATNMEEGALAYKESMELTNSTNLDIALEESHKQLENAQSYNDLLAQRETLINNAVEAGMSKEDATAQVDAYLKGLDGIEEYLSKLSIQTSFAKMLGIDESEVKEKLSGLSEEAQEWLFLNYNEDMSFDSAIEIARKIEESGVADVQASIRYAQTAMNLTDFSESNEKGEFSQEYIDNLFASELGALIDRDEFMKASYQEQKQMILDIYSTEAINIAQNKAAAIEALETEKGLSLETLQQQQAKYDEMMSIMDSENYKAAWENDFGITEDDIKAYLEAQGFDPDATGKEASNRWNEALQDLREQGMTEYFKEQGFLAEDEDLFAVWDSLTAGIENANGELEEFGLTLEDLKDVSSDIEIDVMINDANLKMVQEMVHEVTTLGDNISSVWSLVDSNLKVAAEDVAKIAELYPNLLTNVEHYADGSIKLNQQVVDAFINGQTAELEAEKEKALTSIDSQIALSKATIEMYEKQLEIYAKVVEDNYDLDKAETEAKALLTEFETNNQIEGLGAVTNQAHDSAELQVSYWNDVQAAIGQVANAYAAMYSGEEWKVQTIDLTNGKGSVDYYDADSYQGDKEIAAAAYNAILENYEAEREQLANLEAQRSTLLASYDKALQGPSKSSSSSSSKSSKSQKDYEDEYDRYWEFNKLIEKVTDTIEDLDEAQENLHGRELISALENENRLLDKQAEAYEKLYAEQKREQAELQSSLGSLGLQFDADGAITNYAAQTSQMLSDYNKAVAEYNAGMMNEETFAIYEQNYEKFKTELARYEELYYSEMKDAQDKLEEIRKQQRANNLEAWEINIELKLETSEFERDVANFLHDIEDDFKKVYEDLGDDFENIFANMGTYDADVSTTLQAIKDVTAEIDKMQNGGESDMFESISQAQEKLKDLNKDLQDSASSMHDLWVDAWDTYMEGIDQSADKLEDLNEKYERIGQEIEFQGDLIKLLYGDEAYDLMADYFDAQKTNTLAQVDSFRQQRDMWKQMYESAEDGSEDQQKYYELMNEAQDNLNGSVKEYIELLQNEATNAIDGALKKYENLITNGQGLDVVNEQWERTKDYADAVFDSVEKTYHVQDLASKIKQSINDAEGLKSQQKLQELYDKEINYLLDKKELTQYDIDAANARYQIALKEIALEEAQNAKNSMKVVRGADGNWDYQYVADDENVEEKKRELSDSIYALYELANNSYMESMDNLLEIEQKYQEQAKALAEEAVQTGADVSERKRALDEWYESEKTRISEQGALARQDMLTSSVGVLKDAYDNNVINYENMTNSQIALIEGVSQAGVDSFADLEVKVNDNFQNIGDMAHQVIAETVPEWNSAAWDIAEQWIGDDGSIKQAFEETGATLTQITEDYRTDVDKLGEVADMNLGEDGIAGALQDNIELTEELEGATENLVDTSVDALEEYQDALSAVEDAWYAVKDSITSAIDEIREYLALAGQASNMDVSMSNPTAGRGNNWDFGTGNTGDGGKGSGSGSGSGNGEQGEEDTSLKWSYAGEGYGDNVVRILRGNKLVSIGHINDLWTQYGDAISIYDNKTTLKKKRISTTAAASNMPGFDTGGYTGEWGGGEGRMAMLHSKELVLNAKDTENILDAVSAVRSFASIGNSINEAIMSGIAKMLLSASGKVLGSVSKVDNSSNDNSQNIFHINAEFPNANDMAEIQAAILSLPRIASQQTEIIVK